MSLVYAKLSELSKFTCFLRRKKEQNSKVTLTSTSTLRSKQYQITNFKLVIQLFSKHV